MPPPLSLEQKAEQTGYDYNDKQLQLLGKKCSSRCERIGFLFQFGFNTTKRKNNYIQIGRNQLTEYAQSYVEDTKKHSEGLKTLVIQALKNTDNTIIQAQKLYQLHTTENNKIGNTHKGALIEEVIQLLPKDFPDHLTCTQDIISQYQGALNTSDIPSLAKQMVADYFIEKIAHENIPEEAWNSFRSDVKDFFVKKQNFVDAIRNFVKTTHQQLNEITKNTHNDNRNNLLEYVKKDILDDHLDENLSQLQQEQETLSQKLTEAKKTPELGNVISTIQDNDNKKNAVQQELEKLRSTLEKATQLSTQPFFERREKLLEIFKESGSTALIFTTFETEMKKKIENLETSLQEHNKISDQLKLQKDEIEENIINSPTVTEIKRRLESCKESIISTENSINERNSKLKTQEQEINTYNDNTIQQRLQERYLKSAQESLRKSDSTSEQSIEEQKIEPIFQPMKDSSQEEIIENLYSEHGKNLHPTTWENLKNYLISESEGIEVHPKQDINVLIQNLQKIDTYTDEEVAFLPLLLKREYESDKLFFEQQKHTIEAQKDAIDPKTWEYELNKIEKNQSSLEQRYVNNCKFLELNTKDEWRKYIKEIYVQELAVHNYQYQDYDFSREWYVQSEETVKMQVAANKQPIKACLNLFVQFLTPLIPEKEQESVKNTLLSENFCQEITGAFSSSSNMNIFSRLFSKILEEVIRADQTTTPPGIRFQNAFKKIYENIEMVTKILTSEESFEQKSKTIRELPSKTCFDEWIIGPWKGICKLCSNIDSPKKEATIKKIRKVKAALKKTNTSLSALSITGRLAIHMLPTLLSFVLPKNSSVSLTTQQKKALIALHTSLKDNHFYSCCKELNKVLIQLLDAALEANPEKMNKCLQNSVRAIQKQMILFKECLEKCTFQKIVDNITD